VESAIRRLGNVNVPLVMLVLSAKTLVLHRGTVVNVESVATVAKETVIQSVEAVSAIQVMLEETAKKLVGLVTGDRAVRTVVTARMENHAIQ